MKFLPWWRCDPLTFAAVSSLFVAAALAACSVPARRAIRFDPTIALP